MSVATSCAVSAVLNIRASSIWAFAPAHRPIEIFSGPNIYLFFTLTSAFIHGVSRHEFQYDARTSGVVAGVKFRPGGFYPFLRQSVSKLGEEADILSVFPAANEQFRKKLLDQPDEVIVIMLETLLRNKHPRPNGKLDIITEILSVLDNDSSIQTVEAAARVFGISERSLQLLFQTYVGVGLKWIIARKRLIRAISHVRTDSGRHWVDIAAELGYSSQSHFSREFKAVIGQSPSQSPSQYLRNNVIEK